MKRLAVVVTMLGLAAPALAAETKAQATVMSDSQLDAVTAGCETPATTGAVPAINTNVNFSPIIVNQTAVALTQQTGNVNVANKGKGKGNAKGVLKQNANTFAVNSVNINYHPKF
jgi:hypothetical protein